MIAYVVEILEIYVIPLGALGVFAAAVLEEIIAPIPSAVVQIGSGFLFVSGAVSFSTVSKLIFIVVLPAALGVTVGSLLVYGLAYRFGKPALLKWGKWLGLTWGDVERVQARFEQSSLDEWVLLIFRAIPALPSVAVSALSGLMRIPLKEYLIYTFLGTCIRALVLGAVGWQVGVLYDRYASFVNSIEKGIFIIVILAVVVFVGWRTAVSRKNRAK